MKSGPLFHRKEDWRVTPAEWKEAIAYFREHPDTVKMDRKEDPNRRFSFVQVDGKIYALSNVRYLQKFGGNYGWVKPSIEQPDDPDNQAEKPKYAAIKIEGQDVRGPDNPEAVAAKRAGLMKGEAARRLDPNKVYTDEKYIDKEFKLYTVLEWLEGEDLDKAVASRKLTDTQKWKVALEAAKELARLHKMGIVHCDLKGANFRIQFDENNNPKSVRAMDFGFSKIIPPGENKIRSQFQDGSPGYKAPEISNNLYYAATDTYALAVILLTEINIAGNMNPALKNAFIKKVIDAEKNNVDVMAFLDAQHFDINPPQLKKMLKDMLERNPEQRLPLQKVIDVLHSNLNKKSTLESLPPPPPLPSASKRAKAFLPGQLPPPPLAQGKAPAKTLKEQFSAVNAELKQKLEKAGNKDKKGPSTK